MPDSDKIQYADKDSYFSKLSVWLTIIATVAVTAFLIRLGVTENTEVTQIRQENGYTCVEDYHCQEITDDNAPIGVRKEYTFTLDNNIATDTTLAFYTVHQYVEVWLGEEKVFSIMPSKDNHMIKTVGSNWTMIPVYREDAGKLVRIEITPAYKSFRDRQVDFLIGSELAIYQDRLFKDLAQLILGIMAVFIGVVFVCVAAYNLNKKKREKSLFALGFFSVMMGFWRLTDTRFTPFLLKDKPLLLFYISITMLMLGMIPVMKWMEGYLTKKSRMILNYYCIGAASLCLVQLILQFSGILDIREYLYVTHVVIGVGVFLAIGVVIYERIRYPQKTKIPLGNKISFICLAGILADVTAFYIKGNSSGLMYSLFAFLLYVVFMGISTINNYSEKELQLAEKERQIAEKDRKLAENERKLTDRRIASMMSQIRSHFIFNVLAAISTYCKIDPKKADNALVRFSRYLRKNIKIIEEEGLIDFDMELEQLEDYIALEQLRFEDRIQFEKQIETSSFEIPPLTIQPLVENAIKHGLIEPGKSGTICLHTKRKTGYVEITVTDNGIGFVPEECEKEESVGIRNVRYRLQHMVGGKLTIDSVPGEGTKVTITIPTEEAKK